MMVISEVFDAQNIRAKVSLETGGFDFLYLREEEAESSPEIFTHPKLISGE